MTVKIKLNEKKIQQKVTNDKFGKFVAQQWKGLIDQYTPRETGNLMTNVSLEVPFQIHYKEEYASAVYYNRRGVKFIQVGSDRNPDATDHWDKKAEQAGKKESLYRTLNKALSSGIY